MTKRKDREWEKTFEEYCKEFGYEEKLTLVPTTRSFAELIYHHSVYVNSQKNLSWRRGILRIEKILDKYAELKRTEMLDKYAEVMQLEQKRNNK